MLKSNNFGRRPELIRLEELSVFYFPKLVESFISELHVGNCLFQLRQLNQLLREVQFSELGPEPDLLRNCSAPGDPFHQEWAEWLEHHIWDILDYFNEKATMSQWVKMLEILGAQLETFEPEFLHMRLKEVIGTSMIAKD